MSGTMHRAACDDCGWTSAPTTEARAVYALRRHRCARHVAAAAARARALDRAAQVDRTPASCRHPRAQHQHGTRAAYVLDRCRCIPCTQANTIAEQDRARALLYGTWQPYVAAEPVRRHLEQLRAEGMGLKRVAAVSGVSRNAVTRIVYGVPARGASPSVRVRSARAAALLAVQATPQTLGEVVPVDATGTCRRLQALVAIGWSITELGARLTPPMTAGNIHRVITSARVRSSTARAARVLYDELWNVPPPQDTHRQRLVVSRAREYARRHRWPPPLAWDEDAIDDVAADPEAAFSVTLVAAHTPRRRTKEHLLEDITWLASQGVSLQAAAQQAGVSVEVVLTARRRAGAA